MTERKNAIEFLKRKGRFEFKYLMNSRTGNAILSRLRRFMVLDENAKEKGYYINRSLYFDTDDLKEYYEYVNGEKRRRKFRFRKYALNSNVATFEIKHKLDRIVWKDKVKASYEKTCDFVSDPWEYIDDADFGPLAHQLAKYSYKPKCTVVYQRIALTDIMRCGVRITFDYNLRAGYPEMFNRECTMQDLRVLPPGLFVMEVKFNRVIPTWCRTILSDFNLSYSTYSKYSLSIERLYKNTPLIIGADSTF